MAEKSLILLQQENLELRKENEALKETVSKLLSEMNNVRGIVQKQSNVERMKLTTEERIIEEQIDYFEAISRERALSLEETRAFDLLIKNKRVLAQNKPIEPEYSNIKELNDETHLLLLAENDEPEKPKRTKPKTSSKNTLE